MRLREWLEVARMELSYAARGLARQPGLTAVIVTTLTLGIGANAAIFPMLDRLLFRAPAGVDDVRTLRRVYVTERQDGGPQTRDKYSYPEWRGVEAALVRDTGFDLTGAVGALFAEALLTGFTLAPEGGETP